MHGGLGQSIHSVRNRIFLRLRANLRFRRAGYKETGAAGLNLSAAEGGLERTYGLISFRDSLSAVTYKKNLWTLWLLDRLLAPQLKEFSCEKVLEPGCQDFSRLPALHSFFRTREFLPKITALELDPFPILHDLHSRWDKAHYYQQLTSPRSEFHEANFFDWNEAADLICCFYPFVSEHPALAWGLPSSFGNPLAWLRSFERNLRPGGLLLLVHQGKWEEEEFDTARAGSRLALLCREVLECPFYPLEHPACASVYRLE